MDAEAIKGWVTVVGAVVAAATGVWTLLRQIRGKNDEFVVGLHTVSPSIRQETMLHVISHSDHPIKLTDWGFIEADGRFSSIPMDWEVDPSLGEDLAAVGSSELASRGAVFETGYTRRDDAFGVFAKSVTQKRPRICFAREMPYRRRILIRLRLLLRPNYLA
jgi:hypothetical protein